MYPREIISLQNELKFRLKLGARELWSASQIAPGRTPAISHAHKIISTDCGCGGCGGRTCWVVGSDLGASAGEQGGPGRGGTRS
jgi:hypothetical protein